MPGEFIFFVGAVAVFVFAVITSRLNESLKRLQQRLQRLEARFDAWHIDPGQAASGDKTPDTSASAAPTTTAPETPRPETRRDVPPIPEHASAARPLQQAARKSAPRTVPSTGATDPMALATAWTIAWLKRFFSEGNVPVKVGVLVSFVGVAALLRYAAEQGWLSAPIELRLIGIALVALGALAFAWRQRHDRPLFALSLQGGAIGALMLTVFAAFRLYQLMPTLAAFALLVLLVIATGALALLQNALALAVLALIAGFAAPILVSTGEGSHVALFSYYAVLNLAVLGVTWYRPWPLLNRLGFLATFVIGSGWGVLAYEPEHFASTFPFLLFFSLLYLLVPIRHALNNPQGSKGTLDVLVVFGLPLFAFPLFAALFDGERMAVALCSAVIALVYGLVAWLILRRWQLRPLGDAHVALAVGFASLAVPFAFSGPTVTMIWALEGAALVWIGLRQQQRLAQLAGLALQGLAALTLLGTAVMTGVTGLPILNELYMGALAVCFAVGFSAWRFDLVGTDRAFVNLLAFWAIVVWSLAGILEIDHRAEGALQADLMLVLAGLTAGLGAAVFHWRAWPIAAVTTIISLAVVVPVALAQQIHFSGVLAGWSLPAWGIYLALAWPAQLVLRKAPPDYRLAASLAAHAALMSLAVIGLYNLSTDILGFGSGWQAAMAGIPVILLSAWLSYRERPPFSPWTLPKEQLDILRNCTNGLLLAGLVFSLQLAGNPSPLIFIPVLNPLELAQLAALGLLFRWKLPPHEYKLPALAGLGLLVLTVMALRGAHYLAGIHWQADALLSAPAAQATVTVLWTVFGVTAWILGSRRSDRKLWWCGAVLLGLVLVKLILADRLFLSNVAGIISFLAVGLLSILVGYLAPAPPDNRAVTTDDS